MEIKIYDAELSMVAIIDDYISFIWVDRYNEAGDFELHMAMDSALLDIFKEDYYVMIDDSDRIMIIENVNVTTDSEEGARLTVTGRSFESVLNRRIIINRLNFSIDNSGTYPNLQNAIYQILLGNVISPSTAARKIDNFVFKSSTDEKITSLTVEAQYYGEEVYATIQSLCSDNKIGFKVTLNENDEFEFELFAGTDRSYEQIDNPYVIFSQNYDNLLESNYCKSKSSYKNVAVVAGENDENANADASGYKPRKTYPVGAAIGMDRREIFVDASGVTSNIDGNTTLTPIQYKAHLKQKGIDALIKHSNIEAFEGSVESTQMYKYGVDFFIGDVLQLMDEYGNEGQVRVTEFIRSYDAEGIRMYPTFTTIQKGVYD